MKWKMGQFHFISSTSISNICTEVNLRHQTLSFSRPMIYKSKSELNN